MTKERDAASSLRRQVETLERGNHDQGYPVPTDALVCLRYPEARALLDLLDEPEDLPLATVGEPVHKATEGIGPIRSVCGREGSNLAERWANVTCRACRGHYGPT